MDNKQPLGLPEGSVRAVVLLMFVSTICFDAMWGKHVVDVKDFMSLVTLAMGYYFGTRKAGK